MASLLDSGRQPRTGWDYVRRLLAACTHDGATVPVQTPVGQATRLKNGLVEPLSDRELDVLRHWPPTWTGRPPHVSPSCP